MTLRLLKNSVPSMEYVLMTNEAYSRIGEFHQLKPEMRKENCEGIGKEDVEEQGDEVGARCNVPLLLV